MKTKTKNWVMLTKRTNDPKLAWIESKLAQMGIESRRKGESFHAPILEVPKKDYRRADRLVCAWDDLEDNHPMFT